MPTPPGPRAKVGHVDVAAYVLGILDEPDDAAFSRHFARCQQCRTEYRELSDLPMLLDQLKPTPVRRKQPVRQPAMPGNRVLGGALEQVNKARRTRNRTMWLAAAAAVVLLVTVPLVVINVGGEDGGGQQVAAPTVTVSVPPSTPSSPEETGTDVVAGARTVSSRDPNTGMAATIGMEPQPWGTSVNLELRNVTGPAYCLLVARSESGEEQTVMNWHVPPAGFGVPGSANPEPLRNQGSVGISAERIEMFSIRRGDGAILLEVPVT